MYLERFDLSLFEKGRERCAFDAATQRCCLGVAGR